LHISWKCLNKVSLWFAVVILVPTRELALQTSQVCKELGKHLKIQVMVTTGGTSLKDDIVRLYQPVHLLCWNTWVYFGSYKERCLHFEGMFNAYYGWGNLFQALSECFCIATSCKWPVLSLLCYILFSNVSCHLIITLMSKRIQSEGEFFPSCLFNVNLFINNQRLWPPKANLSISQWTSVSELHPK
jgi:hypothetical protein